MPAHCAIGDKIVNDRGVCCTVVEHKDDFYLVQAPDGSLENITEREINLLESYTE